MIEFKTKNDEKISIDPSMIIVIRGCETGTKLYMKENGIIVVSESWEIVQQKINKSANHRVKGGII